VNTLTAFDDLNFEDDDRILFERGEEILEDDDD
jgi:hypothetical protein